MSGHHSHSHEHNPKDYNKLFIIGIFLNLGFVFVELIYGFISDSLSLIADAGHNFSDVFSLVLAWTANILSAKPSTEKRTYGLKKITIIASLASAIILMITVIAMVWEAVERFSKPVAVEGISIIIVALIGVVINTITALFFLTGQEEDLNIRGAFLHMAADAAVSLGVVIGGILILFFHWSWIDPLITIFIALVIVYLSWNLLKESTALSLDFVPDKIDISGIKNYLSQVEEVISYHDLHVWAISTTETALTVHVIVKGLSIDNSFLNKIQDNLIHNFGIDHPTIQIEFNESNSETPHDPKCN